MNKEEFEKVHEEVINKESSPEVHDMAMMMTEALHPVAKLIRQARQVDIKTGNRMRDTIISTLITANSDNMDEAFTCLEKVKKDLTHMDNLLNSK